MKVDHATGRLRPVGYRTSTKILPGQLRAEESTLILLDASVLRCVAMDISDFDAWITPTAGWRRQPSLPAGESLYQGIEQRLTEQLQFTR